MGAMLIHLDRILCNVGGSLYTWAASWVPLGQLLGQFCPLLGKPKFGEFQGPQGADEKQPLGRHFVRLDIFL